jgi:hypothetical protein
MTGRGRFGRARYVLDLSDESVARWEEHLDVLDLFRFTSLLQSNSLPIWRCLAFAGGPNKCVTCITLS